jgi:hypothetical protein
MAEKWLINPARSKRRKNKPYKKRSRNPMARAVRRKNPRRRRRHRARRNPVSIGFKRNPRRRRRSVRRRRNPPAALYMNRTRRRRHRYRRNPPELRALGSDLLWGAAGLMGTKFISNTLTPMVGSTIAGQPLMRIAWNLGMAYVSAWGLSMVTSERNFTPAFIGGSMIAAQDFITNYVTPLVPQIAGGGMGVYYQGPRMLPAPARMGMGVYSRPPVSRHEVAQ